MTEEQLWKMRKCARIGMEFNLDRLLEERKRLLEALSEIVSPVPAGGWRSVPMEDGRAAIVFAEEEAP